LGTHKGVQVSEENVVEGAKGSRDMVKWRLTEVKIVWGGHRSVSFYSYTMRPRHVSCTELTISFQLIGIPQVPVPFSTEQVGLCMTRFESCTREMHIHKEILLVSLCLSKWITGYCIEIGHNLFP
jgi:hypothetical protein